MVTQYKLKKIVKYFWKPIFKIFYNQIVINPLTAASLYIVILSALQN